MTALCHIGQRSCDRSEKKRRQAAALQSEFSLLLRKPAITALQVATRAAVAAGIAVALAEVLRLEFPIYSMIAAIIVTDLSAARTRQLGLQRMLGTIVGATIGAAVSIFVARFSHFGPIAIAAGVFVSILISHACGIKDAAKLAGYVCGIVLLDHHDHPWTYALYRLIETLLGIAAAVGVSVVPKLLSVGDPEELLDEKVRNR